MDGGIAVLGGNGHGICMQTGFRPPAVAGLFYPREPDRLRNTVEAFVLSGSSAPAPGSGALSAQGRAEFPKALIVPHAGFVYSGPIAGSAYALWQGGEHIERVVLIGPSHRVFLRGMAGPGVSAMRTPLGDVPVDAEAFSRVPHVSSQPRAHAQEHSLEVQLPFLQVVLPRAKVVPMVCGEASPAEVGAVLEALWGGRETVVLVSSDLSHYLPYREAQAVDRQTAEHIVSPQSQTGDILPDQACGCSGVNGLLWLAGRKKLRARLLDLRNSGDTAGDKDRVVGYGAFAFFETRGETC